MAWNRERLLSTMKTNSQAIEILVYARLKQINFNNKSLLNHEMYLSYFFNAEYDMKCGIKVFEFQNLEYLNVLKRCPRSKIHNFIKNVSSFITKVIWMIYVVRVILNTWIQMAFFKWK